MYTNTLCIHTCTWKYAKTCWMASCWCWMVGSDCAPFHWEGLSQEWWIPQNNSFNEKNDGKWWNTLAFPWVTHRPRLVRRGWSPKLRSWPGSWAWRHPTFVGPYLEVSYVLIPKSSWHRFNPKSWSMTTGWFGKSPCFMVTISMAIFNSKLWVYQRVAPFDETRSMSTDDWGPWEEPMKLEGPRSCKSVSGLQGWWVNPGSDQATHIVNKCEYIIQLVCRYWSILIYLWTTTYLHTLYYEVSKIPPPGDKFQGSRMGLRFNSRPLTPPTLGGFGFWNCIFLCWNLQLPPT